MVAHVCIFLAYLRETRIYRAMKSALHTVAETRAFQRQAADAGMSDAEISALVSYLASNPTAGDEITGTGGCRKVRVAGRGKGKSGGYRTITFYSGEQMPVFLLAVFSKGDRANLSRDERNALAVLTKAIVAEYQKRIVRARA
jgi:hypothetical protein